MANDKYLDLVERGKKGKLSSSELQIIAGLLQEPNDDVGLYTILYILGEHRDISFVPLVEPFLEGPDALYAYVALQTLCWGWKLTARYVDQLLLFMSGVPWDEGEDCKLCATAIAGDYMITTYEPRLLRELFHIWYSEKQKDILRLVAYRSIVKATGGDWRGIPISATKFNFETDPDRRVLEKAMKMLADSREMPGE